MPPWSCLLRSQKVLWGKTHLRINCCKSRHSRFLSLKTYSRGFLKRHVYLFSDIAETIRKKQTLHHVEPTLFFLQFFVKLQKSSLCSGETFVWSVCRKSYSASFFKNTLRNFSIKVWAFNRSLNKKEDFPYKNIWVSHVLSKDSHTQQNEVSKTIREQL